MTSLIPAWINARVQSAHGFGSQFKYARELLSETPTRAALKIALRSACSTQ
jgi:hypothetical protein